MLLGLGTVLAFTLPRAALAQTPSPSPASVMALETLTQNSSTTASSPSRGQGTIAPAPQASAPMRPKGQHSTLVVQPGQTLDIIIRQHLPDQPFKHDVIRRAIMDLNPAAFPLNTPHLIRAGAVLLVPTPEQIRQSAVSRNPVLAPYLGAIDAQGQIGSRPRGASGEERRKWVRYP